MRALEERPPYVLAPPKIADSWLQIVGIAGDARNDGLRNPIPPAVLVPYTLELWGGTQILVRSEISPLALLNSLRTQLTKVNPEQQTYSRVEDLALASGGKERGPRGTLAPGMKSPLRADVAGNGWFRRRLCFSRAHF